MTHAPQLSWLDRLIGVFSPRIAFHRVACREGMRAYLKAGETSRTSRSWRKNTGTPDEVFAADGKTTRQRALYLAENNAQVGGAILALTDHIVGADGITTQSEIRFNPNARPDDSAAITARNRLNQQVEDAKNAWLETAWHTEAVRLNPVEAQTLRLRNLITTGEDIVHRRFLGTRDFPLAYETIDPAQLEGAYGRPARGNLIESGIEYAPDRTIVAYHITDNGYNPRPTRVPAADIIHTFRTDRPGQQRGISWLAPIIPRVYELEDIIEYALIARRVQSAIAVLVSRNPNNIGVGSAMPGLAAPSGETTADTAGNKYQALQPGMIHDVGTGNVTAFTPSQATDLDALTGVVLRAIAVGIGVSYEWVSGDYRQANFASARLGENRTWKRVYGVHGFFVRRTEHPMHRDFIDLAHALGIIPAIPARANPYAATYSKPHRDWGVNPLQEVNAIIAALAAGLTSLPDETAKRGIDWRQLLQRISESTDFARLLNPAFNLYAGLFNQPGPADTGE